MAFWSEFRSEIPDPPPFIKTWTLPGSPEAKTKHNGEEIGKGVVAVVEAGQPFVDGSKCQVIVTCVRIICAP